MIQEEKKIKMWLKRLTNPRNEFQIYLIHLDAKTNDEIVVFIQQFGNVVKSVTNVLEIFETEMHAVLLLQNC